jgi:hypothetical protein
LDAQTAATLQQTNAGLNLAQNLVSLAQWDSMNDLGRFSTALNLANNIDILSHGAVNNIGSLQGLNTAASIISLAQSIESGNLLGTLSSVNGLSGQAIDSAVNQALGTTGVPYIGIALALNDFEHHPGQSIGSLVGLAMGGAIGSALGGTIGGFVDSLFGGGRSSPPPPPEGQTHFAWDANGNIQLQMDRNQSGGGDAAMQVAHSVQSLLNGMVQGINDQTADPADNVAINPYLLPKIGFSGQSAWMEVTNFDGTTTREGIRSDTIAHRLLEILSDNGALAPAWQVQTQRMHMETLQAQGVSSADIAAQMSAGAGGHAQAGNQAFALQGNAVESADFKTQSFGALVVKLGSLAGGVEDAMQGAAQSAAQSIATTQILKNIAHEGAGNSKRVKLTGVNWESEHFAKASNSPNFKEAA